MSGIRAIVSFDDIDSTILLDSLDTDLILGKKYPLLDVPMITEWDKEHETKGEFFLRMERLNQDPSKRASVIEQDKRNREKHVENKKYGYWDNMFSSSGVAFKLQHHGIIEEIKTRPPFKNYISKMTYDGICKSCPAYVGKIVLIIRYPHNKKESEFLRQARDLCKWFIVCPEVDVHVIDYNDMLTREDSVKLRIKHILGTELKDLVDIPAYNPVPKNTINAICELMLSKDFEGAYERCLREIEGRGRGNNTWKCMRTGKKTTEEQCKLCLVNADVRNTLKMRAIKNNIDWMHLPCLYQCGKGTDREPITFEESIKNNFWV
jgi:hypothetical protein